MLAQRGVVYSIVRDDESNEGFDEIEFCLNGVEEEDGFISKPFVIFRLPNTAENQDYLQTVATAISEWGETKITTDEIAITLTGKKQIYLAYEFLFKVDKTPYSAQVNQDLYFYFYQELQALIYADKQSNKIKPRKSIDYAKYTQFDHYNVGSNNLHCSAYKRKKNHSKLYSIHIFKVPKDNDAPRSKLLEIEPFAAAIAGLIMGLDQVPKMKSVYKEAVGVGVASKKLDGFWPASVIFNPAQSHKFTFTELIEMRIIEAMVTSFVIVDIDCRPENWGTQIYQHKGQYFAGKISRIDFDFAFFSKTCKYHGWGPNKIPEPKVGKAFRSKPNDVFAITPANLLAFPIIVDGVPYNWFLEKDDKVIFNLLKGIEFHPQFDYRKWKSFLRAVLIISAIKANAEAYVGSTHAQREYTKYLHHRLSSLETCLLSLPPFQQFLVENHKKVKIELMAEFHYYNTFIKAKDNDLKIDLVQVENHYDLIYKQAYRIYEPIQETLVPAWLEENTQENQPSQVEQDITQHQPSFLVTEEAESGSSFTFEDIDLDSPFSFSNR